MALVIDVGRSTASTGTQTLSIPISRRVKIKYWQSSE